MTSNTSALWITEADVASMLDMGAAMAALEQGLQLEARGEATNMSKTHVGWTGGNLHAIGASFGGAGVAGTKTWAYTPNGATPLLILFNSTSGSLLAVIEAFALGQMRTASASGVATKWLAKPEARTFGVIGTGEQALPQIAAVAAVRPLETVRVFGRNAARRAAFAAKVRDELGLNVTGVDSVAAAADGAEIITLATRATEPFLRPSMVARGAHVNAIGAITPERAEFEPELLDRCDLIVADSVDQTKRLSREFMAYFGENRKPWSMVTPLSAVVAQEQRRPAAADVTLFKAMGMGISDLSLGIQCYRKAAERGIGRPIPAPQRVHLQLKSTTLPGGVR
jgi:ornithine cyclodeaminase